MSREKESLMEIKKIRKRLKKLLDRDRYHHTVGVCYTAMSMAMRYGLDLYAAGLAGILHDCGKYGTPEEIRQRCLDQEIEISADEEENPGLLHAKLGAFYAARLYGVEDREVLHAIRYHTTGRPGMSALEKIIFIADYIEPHRDRAPRLEQVRREAFCDLDRTIVMITEDTLGYLEKKGVPVDGLTRETYQYYVNVLKEKEGRTEE